MGTVKHLTSTVALGILTFAAACRPAAAPTAVSLPAVSNTPSPAAAASVPVQTGSAAETPLPTATAAQTLAAAPSAAAGQAPTSAAGGGLTLTSAAFAEGGSIPKKYTCDGSSISPPLKWSGAPANAASFALIVDDPDAPSGTFTHWVAFDIPANQTEIPEGAQNVERAGQNGARKNGYTGPCPPSGTHHYVFKLYALDIPLLGLNEGATKAQVMTAIQGHILAQGQLIGLYGR